MSFHTVHAMNIQLLQNSSTLESSATKTTS